MGKDFLWVKVSPCGIVTSPHGETLEAWTGGSGKYKFVRVGEGKCGELPVHMLVATVYLANPDNKPCVRHKDFNTKNNNINNLEWVTGVEYVSYYDQITANNESELT